MLKYPLALLPTVTVRDGRSALAPQGFGASESSGTPQQAVSSWVAQGAAWVHVVDADAIEGRTPLAHLGGGAHLQYSGAVHDDASLAHALTLSASRVVIESDDLRWVLGAVSRHEDTVAVGLDIRQPEVFDTVSRLERGGCRRFVVTDRAEAHHWRHGDRHLLQELCAQTNVPVMARGGIAHLSDLHALHELVPQGLDGIIIDDALYDGAFSYTEAVAAGADRFDMFFWGPPQ